jgi:hypothetical protein
MTRTAITWKTGQYSAKYGFIGKTRVFSTVLGMASGSDTPWQLKANLPGIKQITEHATEAAAQETAETMLRIHLNSLVKAGVELPKADHIDAALDPKLLDATAQAIARVTFRDEFACDDEMWAVIWQGLSPQARLGYRFKAQAALKA